MLGVAWLFCCAVLGACASPTQTDLAKAATASTQAARPDLAAAGDTTLILVPSADTYVRSGPPNEAKGGELVLSVDGGGRERTLVTFARATWNCAVDSDPSNQRADCAGPTAWELGPTGQNPWLAPPTATTTITNRQSGVVAFDVMADVRGWLEGEANAAWIVRAVDEGQNGRVRFGSRESSTPPRLVLTVARVGEPLDTIWPVLTGYEPILDTTVVLPRSTGPDPLIFFRTVINITFEDGVSDAAKAAFFARHSLTVLGVSPAYLFYVRIPDPGMDVQAYDALLDTLQAEPETRNVLPLIFRGMGIIRHARFPDDGSGQHRADWLEGAPSTWAMRAVRAPLAWGCETCKAWFRPTPPAPPPPAARTGAARRAGVPRARGRGGSLPRSWAR